MTAYQYYMKHRHYKPASKTPICGAVAKIIEMIEEGEADKHDILHIMTTSDIEKVTCGECQRRIKLSVLKWVVFDKIPD